MEDFFTVNHFWNIGLMALIMLDGYYAGRAIEQKEYGKAGLNIGLMVVVMIILTARIVSITVNVNNIGV